MIRRILMLAFVLLVFTMPTEAITLQELHLRLPKYLFCRAFALCTAAVHIAWNLLYSYGCILWGWDSRETAYCRV